MGGCPSCPCQPCPFPPCPFLSMSGSIVSIISMDAMSCNKDKDKQMCSKHQTNDVFLEGGGSRISNIEFEPKKCTNVLSAKFSLRNHQLLDKTCPPRFTFTRFTEIHIWSGNYLWYPFHMGADWVPPLVNDVIVGSPGRSNSLVRSSACPSTSRYCADYHHLVSFFVHQRPTYKMKQVLTSVFEIFDLNHQNTRPCKSCLHKLTSLCCFSYNLSLLWRISWSWVSPCLLLSPQIAKRSWVLVMVRLEWDKCIISWGLDKSTLGWISLLLVVTVDPQTLFCFGEWAES